MNEELNEQEIRQLERELRSYGDPYTSPEPDERYFANFRAHVMQRISEQPEAVGLMQRVSEFFFGSTLRMALTGGSLVAGALVYFSLQSSPEIPVAEIPIQKPEIVAPPMPTVEQPTVTAPMPEKQMTQPSKGLAARNETQHSAPVAPVAEQDQVSANNSVSNIAEASAQFDQMDELSVSDESEPVSYDRLSMEELETVLKTLETEPLTIQ